MGPNCLVIAGEKSGEEHCLSFFERLIEWKCVYPISPCFVASQPEKVFPLPLAKLSHDHF